jgi:hypothetical protein
MRGEKAPVFATVHGHAERVLPVLHRRAQAVLTGLRDPQAQRPRGLQRVARRRLQGGNTLVVGPVDNAEAAPLEPPRVVTHGTEDQGDLVPVVAHVGRLLGDLGEEKHVPPGLRSGQQRVVRAQLVAEYQAQ